MEYDIHINIINRDTGKELSHDESKRIFDEYVKMQATNVAAEYISDDLIMRVVGQVLRHISSDN